MQKTTVYLPERLKAELGALAKVQQRSEAHLIRLAVERLLAAERSPRAARELNLHDDPTARDAPVNPRGVALVGVGVGPGDPRLLTLQAIDELRAADRVFAPCTSAEAVGRAESIVRQVAPELSMERLVFVMAPDGAARDAAIALAVERIVECLDGGERVAFVTLGDPNIYSTFGSLAEAVRSQRPAVPVETVAGIMAFQDLAARSSTVLVDGRERLSLVTAVRDTDDVEAALTDAEAAVVVYKGGRHLPAIADRLDAAGRLDGAVAGELLGLPGERLAPVADVARQPATYLATIIVPPRSRAAERAAERSAPEPRS